MTQQIMPLRGVTKNYGVRTTGGANGQYKSEGPVKSLSFKINREWLRDAAAGNVVLNSFVWNGVSILSAKLLVKQAFDGTSAFTLSTTSQGSIPISAGDLNAVDSVDLTPTGNLAVGDMTTATENFTLSGITNGTGSAGEAEVYIEYIQTELP